MDCQPRRALPLPDTLDFPGQSRMDPGGVDPGGSPRPCRRIAVHHTCRRHGAIDIEGDAVVQCDKHAVPSMPGFQVTHRGHDDTTRLRSKWAATLDDGDVMRLCLVKGAAKPTGWHNVRVIDVEPVRGLTPPGRNRSLSLKEKQRPLRRDGRMNTAAGVPSARARC